MGYSDNILSDYLGGLGGTFWKEKTTQKRRRIRRFCTQYARILLNYL
jgi:hypothetical protein